MCYFGLWKSIDTNKIEFKSVCRYSEIRQILVSSQWGS